MNNSVDKLIEELCNYIKRRIESNDLESGKDVAENTKALAVLVNARTVASESDESERESISVHVDSNIDEVKREITELRDLLKEANSLLDELASKEDVLKIIATL